MLRTYDNSFPNIQKSFRNEKLNNYEHFNDKLKKLTNFKLTSSFTK